LEAGAIDNAGNRDETEGRRVIIARSRRLRRSPPGFSRVAVVKGCSMSGECLDFRSDTVTRPSPGMRAAMAQAEVGDDVFGDDPSVNRLQEKIAAILGKEAALFVPSGTMSNLISVRLHCRPGDGLICEAGCHIHSFEQGGYAQINGVAAQPVVGEQGIMRLEQLDGLVWADNPHFPRARLLCLENTHNRGGGRIQPYEIVESLCGWAQQHGLRTHLDGARLFNAVVATGIEAARWARHFDTVSVCFSKGLGAPVGSAVAGPRELVREAVRHRKVFGGGMRQAGVLAAAAIYALDQNIERLAEDHANARRLAAGIGQIERVRLASETFDTNLLYFRVDPAWMTAAALASRLAEHGVLMVATGRDTVRAVTHLDVSATDVDRAIEVLKRVVRS
jgi:threonine aldolase